MLFYISGDIVGAVYHQLRTDYLLRDPCFTVRLRVLAVVTYTHR